MGFDETDVREMFRYYQQNDMLKGDAEAMITEMKPWYDNYCFEEKAYLDAHFELIHIKKGEHLVTRGEEVCYLYYLEMCIRDRRKGCHSFHPPTGHAILHWPVLFLARWQASREVFEGDAPFVEGFADDDAPQALPV